MKKLAATIALLAVWPILMLVLSIIIACEISQAVAQAIIGTWMHG